MGAASKRMDNRSPNLGKKKSRSHSAIDLNKVDLMDGQVNNSNICCNFMERGCRGRGQHQLGVVAGYKWMSKYM